MESSPAAIPAYLALDDAVQRLAAHDYCIVLIHRKMGEHYVVIHNHIELRTHLAAVVCSLPGRN